MSGGENDFRVRPGRIRSARAGKAKSFVNQVLRAAQKAGHLASQSSAGSRTKLGRSTFGRGRIAFSHSRLFSASRRVMVKARIARHKSRAFRSAPLSAHLSYLKREGVARDSEKARLFDADSDCADGRAHHVRFRGVDAFDHSPPIGGIVELRRFGGADDQQPTLVLANRSDFNLAQQVTAPGATWLDYRLVERQPTPLSMGGFGREVRDAMTARAEYLAEEGFARRYGQRIILQRDLLDALRRRELEAVGAKLSANTGSPYVQSAAGEHVSGTYRQRLTLSSGRFAMIDNGLGFQLVPWSATLEKQLGRHVAGVAKDGGEIEWSFGRKRGLEL